MCKVRGGKISFRTQLKVQKKLFCPNCHSRFKQFCAGILKYFNYFYLSNLWSPTINLMSAKSNSTMIQYSARKKRLKEEGQKTEATANDWKLNLIGRNLRRGAKKSLILKRETPNQLICKWFLWKRFHSSLFGSLAFLLSMICSTVCAYDEKEQDRCFNAEIF